MNNTKELLGKILEKDSIYKPEYITTALERIEENDYQKAHEALELGQADQDLTFDLEIEKRFYYRDFNIGVFCQVYNLLDRKNVRTVYSGSGKADDFGPLEPASQEYMKDPTNYFAPLTIYLGISVGI